MRRAGVLLAGVASFGLGAAALAQSQGGTSAHQATGQTQHTTQQQQQPPQRQQTQTDQGAGAQTPQPQAQQQQGQGDTVGGGYGSYGPPLDWGHPVPMNSPQAGGQPQGSSYLNWSQASPAPSQGGEQLGNVPSAQQQQQQQQPMMMGQMPQQGTQAQQGTQPQQQGTQQQKPVQPGGQQPSKSQGTQHNK